MNVYNENNFTASASINDPREFWMSLSYMQYTGLVNVLI